MQSFASAFGAYQVKRYWERIFNGIQFIKDFLIPPETHIVVKPKKATFHLTNIFSRRIDFGVRRFIAALIAINADKSRELIPGSGMVHIAGKSGDESPHSKVPLAAINI